VSHELESPVRWCTAPDVVWTRFDDNEQWVVYSPASSDIHLLTASAHRLWTLVATDPPSSSEQLAARLATDLKLPFDREFLTVTSDALAVLDEAGLVRPVTP
jgi:PqqD family protein of HPr-rel-A system